MEGKNLVPAMEEIINPVEPNLDLPVVLTHKTPWIYADDAAPVKNISGVEKAVRCMITEVTVMDLYGMPDQHGHSVQVRHQYCDTKGKRWSKDEAYSLLTPSGYMASRTVDATVPGLKDRFGTAIAEYLKVLVREGRDIPIVFLTDKVYPEVVNCLVANGIRTVNAFAALEGEGLQHFKEGLVRAKLAAQVGNVAEFQKRAQAMLSNLGVGEEIKARKKAA